jgi:hypothetical protein
MGRGEGRKEEFRNPAENNHIGSVAQRLEQGTHNPLVLGSNPSAPIVLPGGKVADRMPGLEKPCIATHLAEFMASLLVGG